MILPFYLLIFKINLFRNYTLKRETRKMQLYSMDFSLFFLPLNVFRKRKFLLIWWESIQVTRPLSCLIETNSCIIHVYRIHYFYMNLNNLYFGFLGPLNTCLKWSWRCASAFIRTSYVKRLLDYYGRYWEFVNRGHRPFTFFEIKLCKSLDSADWYCQLLTVQVHISVIYISTSSSCAHW